MRIAILFFFILAAAQATVPAIAESRRGIAGPVEAQVIRVIDGDTFLADAHVWPGHTIRVSVRIRGIDAPEMRTRCEEERAAAIEARDMLERLIGEKPVTIFNIGGGKYYGRVLADVTVADGTRTDEALLGLGLVRAYEGGRRVSMCSPEAGQAPTPT